MKVTLLHCYADDNKGDQGIILGTLAALGDVCRKNGLEKPFITAVSTFSKSDITTGRAHRFLMHHVDVIVPSTLPQRVQESKSPLRSLYKMLVFPLWFMGAMILFTLRIYTPEQRAIREADLVISKGGSFLYSKGGLRGFFFLMRMLLPLFWAIRLKKNAIILGQSLGPFEGRITRFITQYIFRRLKKIYPRERYSYDLLIDLGIPKNTLELIPDTAFYLGKGRKKPRSPSKPQILGVTARHLSPDPATQLLFEEKITRILEAVIEKGWSIHFIPQVTGPDPLQDDREVQQRLYKRMDPKYRIKAKCTITDLSVKELCAEYALCDLVLATRLHSAIFAATQLTPAVVLEYQQQKAKGTFEWLGLEDLVLPWDVPEDNLKDTLLSAMERPQALLQVLNDNIPLLIRKLKEIYDTEIF